MSFIYKKKKASLSPIGLTATDPEMETCRVCGSLWPPHPLLFRDRLTFLTEAACIAGEAKADEGVDLIDAGTSILTGAGDTVVNVWRGEGERLNERSASPWLPVPTGNQTEDGVMTLPSIRTRVQHQWSAHKAPCF